MLPTEITIFSNMPEPLLEDNIKVKDPIHIFQEWHEDTRSKGGCAMPNSFCLTTANAEGRPSARIMTLTSFSTYGFIFVTNSLSRKGRDMSQNKKVNITFHWIQFLRTVSIDGDIEECQSNVAEDSFRNRKIDAKYWANIGNQGTPVINRKFLENKKQELKIQYPDSTSIPKPDHWKAYVVKPRSFLFWQGHCGEVIQDKLFFYKPPVESEKVNEFALEGENGWMYYRVQS